MVILVSTAFLMFFNNDKMLYGTYEYFNEDGTKSIVKIDENYVYFENIDYESCEDLAVTMYRLNKATNDDKTDAIHHHVLQSSQEEREKMKAEMDYKTVYDKKFDVKMEECIDLSGKKTGEFSCLAKSPDEEIYGISVLVNPKEKTCIIGADVGEFYKYTGK